jgi:glycosyltransferase involved in cell wall biosynthesis
MFFEVKVMKKPKVSIILPCYNHENYLKERLDSIFNQTYQNFEVIILDDASTDGSQDLLIEYKKHVKVSHHIINTKNSGSPFLQWQKGLELAIGDYVWIAESDDSCDINFLKSNLEKIEQENANICVAKTFKYAKGRTSSEVNHPIFRNKNKETAKEYYKEYYKKNKENIINYIKKYRKENRESIKKREQKYREKNKEKKREYLKKYLKERRKTDFLFRLRGNISANIKESLNI